MSPNLKPVNSHSLTKYSFATKIIIIALGPIVDCRSPFASAQHRFARVFTKHKRFYVLRPPPRKMEKKASGMAIGVGLFADYCVYFGRCSVCVCV